MGKEISRGKRGIPINGTVKQVTFIHEKRLTIELYNKAIDLFGEEKTAQVLAAIITINAWNRIGVALNMHPHLITAPLALDPSPEFNNI